SYFIDAKCRCGQACRLRAWNLNLQMLRISRELIDRILDEPDSIEAIAQISQYLWPRDRNALDLGMSRPELDFYCFSNYDAEVCRNGHLWFFLNPSGNDVRQVLTALETMKLSRPRAILLEACSVFPDSQVPESQDDRIGIIKTLPHTETRALWNRLDQAYF